MPAALSSTLLDSALRLALAQIVDPPQLPDVPTPPLWSLWLFERPVAAAAILAGVGVVVAWVMLSRGRGRPALAAAVGGLALGAGAWALGTGVTTDRERLARATRDLVAAVAAGDSGATAPLLDERVRLYSTWSPAGWDGPRILAAVDRAEAGVVTRHDIREIRGGVDDRGVGRILVRVMVEVQGWNAPIPSWWRIDWRLDAGEPRAIVIEPLWISGRNDVRGRAG